MDDGARMNGKGEPEIADQRLDVASAHVKHVHTPTLPSSRPEEEKALLWKQDLRIIPVSAGMDLLCFLDRANIGNARVFNVSTHDDLQNSAGMTSYQFNVALMIFLIAYAAFQVPSNMLLKKLRPSRWLAFLMLSWGVITVSMSGTRTFASVTVVRFLVAVFEAGLLPGLIYHLTFSMSAAVAILLASATLAGAGINSFGPVYQFGGAIAYGIGRINGAAGLRGWRWLFILEGAPSCLAALLVFFLLPDFPETAGWLSKAERDLVVRRLHHQGSKGHDPAMTWADAKATLTDWRLYAHYVVNLAVGPAFASLSLFAPSITKGLGFVDLRAQLMTVPAWAVAYVCQIVVGLSAERFNARGLHIAGAALVGAVGFIVSAALPPTAYAARYGGLVLAVAGTFPSVPPMLGWISSSVASTAATGMAIAINVSIGAGLGQIPGVWIYKANQAERGYPTGHWTNAGCLLFATIVSLGLRLFYGWKNKHLAAAARGD